MAPFDDTLVFISSTPVSWHKIAASYAYRVIIALYRSSGAYEALRDSGCIKLPSQRTLRDYTHYVKASCGFSSEVDDMLISASQVKKCPEREKYVVLLLDEMHIREDLIFDKHSGKMIG